jgi:hypothetical protein
MGPFMVGSWLRLWQQSRQPLTQQGSDTRQLHARIDIIPTVGRGPPSECVPSEPCRSRPLSWGTPRRLGAPAGAATTQVRVLPRDARWSAVCGTLHGSVPVRAPGEVVVAGLPLRSLPVPRSTEPTCRGQP